MTDSRIWIGFDLGGTKMLCHVYDAEFNLLSSNREKTQGHQGAERGVERMLGTIDEALERIDISRADLAGIGVGCPGPLDLDSGVILDAPNLGWKNVALKQAIEQQLGCPAVILNDVDAGVYGEYRFGAGRDAHCLLGVFPGTGIGGACVYRGEVLRGRTGTCMEFGHMLVDPDGPLCGCGRYGCLEAVASRLAISTEAIKAAYRGDAPHLMKNYGTDLSKIRSKALADSIRNGDKAVADILANAAQKIGTAVGNVVNLLLPDVIVLGGGLVEAMPKRFVGPVWESAKARAMPAFADSFEVVPAKLGDDAGALGAAAWAQHTVAEPHATR